MIPKIVVLQWVLLQAFGSEICDYRVLSDKRFGSAPLTEWCFANAWQFYTNNLAYDFVFRFKNVSLVGFRLINPVCPIIIDFPKFSSVIQIHNAIYLSGELELGCSVWNSYSYKPGFVPTFQFSRGTYIFGVLDKILCWELIFLFN